MTDYTLDQTSLFAARGKATEDVEIAKICLQQINTTIAYDIARFLMLGADTHHSLERTARVLAMTPERLLYHIEERQDDAQREFKKLETMRNSFALKEV